MSRLLSSLSRHFKSTACIYTDGAQTATNVAAKNFISAYPKFSHVAMDLQPQDLPGPSSSTAKIQLYSFWQSSCSWRVRFALNLKELDYEYNAVDLSKGEQFAPEFENLNPMHFVPVLVDGGLVVSDSFAILLYLDEKYPQKTLLPLDLKRKAVNLQVASIIGSSIQPLHMQSVLTFLGGKVNPEDVQSWAIHYILKGFSALENLLKCYAGKYATGDQVLMADVFLAPQISIATRRFNVDMSNFPTLHRIYEACQELPAFQASLPERQPDAKLP